MENNSENFDELQRLLALKKHEQPPPGYFNRFSGEVIARIQEEQRAKPDFTTRLNAEAPWLLRLWRALEGKPAFAGVFGAAVCALLLAGIFVAEKPAAAPQFAQPGATQQNIPVMAASPASAPAGLNQPMLMTSTNPAGTGELNLFDLIKPGQTAPVSFGATGR